MTPKPELPDITYGNADDEQDRGWLLGRWRAGSDREQRKEAGDGLFHQTHFLSLGPIGRFSIASDVLEA